MIETEPARARDGDHAYDATDQQLAMKLALLVALLGAVRVSSADYALWFDEFATLIFSDLPLRQLWSGWMVNETNPPLFYTLMKGWQALGFESNFALRLLPILCSMAALALLALAARIGWGPRAAVSAVLIAGVSPLHIFVSQTLRGYILGSVGVMLAFVGLLVLLRQSHEPASRSAANPSRPLALYVVGSTLAIYCHTTLILWPPIAMAAVAVAVGRQMLERKARLLRQLILANLSVAALAGWWLGVTFAQLLQGAENVSWIRPLSLFGYVDIFSRSVFLVNQSYKVEGILVAAVAFVMLASIVAARRNMATRLAALIFAIGAATFWIVTLVHPIATAMTLFWFLPFVALLIAGGLSTITDIGRERQARLALIVVLSANLLMHGSQLTYQDFGAAIRTVAQDPGTGLLVEGATMGAVSAKACAREFPQQPCPVPILILQMGQPERSWATALGTIGTLSPTQLPRSLGCCRAVYTLRTFDMDPLLDFRIRDKQSRIGWNEPFIEGPIATNRFDPANYHVPGPWYWDKDD